MDFENDSLIKVIDVDSEYKHPQPEFYNEKDLLKNDLQKLIIRNTQQLQISSALKNILNLGKIQYFEKNNTTVGFDYKKLLDIEPSINLEFELKGKKIPLINKKSLTLSASQFTKYSQCPKKYKFSHVLRVPEPSQTFLSLGNVVHKTFQTLSFRQKDGKPISQKLAYTLLEQYWDSVSYNSDVKEKQDKARAKKMIKNFLKWTSSNSNKVVGVELAFNIKLKGITVRGKIDRLEQDDQGNYYVIDYKTGACFESENTISENIQMNVYALAIEQKFHKLPVQASLFYVNDDKLIKYFITDSKSVDVFKQKLENIIESILNEEFEANPAEGFWTCKRCPFKNICEEACMN